MAYQFRNGTDEERLAVLRAHPDLAGKLAAARQLTAELTQEQASAGLDALTDLEKQTFTALNKAYVERFGHFSSLRKSPYKSQYLRGFDRMTDSASEFQEAFNRLKKLQASE